MLPAVKDYLLKTEHEIKLADIAEVSVQRLYKAVDELQYGQFILHTRVISHILKNAISSIQQRIAIRYCQVFCSQEASLPQGKALGCMQHNDM